jgi:hypothetical protein
LVTRTKKNIKNIKQAFVIFLIEKSIMTNFSNSKFEIKVLSPQIFMLKPFEGIELNVDDVNEMREVYLRLSNGSKFAVLLDATNAFDTTDEARKLLASKEFAEKRVAAAFVTKSLANKIIGSFFIKFNKPVSPTKLFTDEKLALEWLKEQMK